MTISLEARPGECSFCESRVMVAQSPTVTTKRRGLVGPLAICGECVDEAEQALLKVGARRAHVSSVVAAHRKDEDDDEVMEVSDG